MTKRMLIDATHPEETRVAVINGNRLEEYDYETTVRKQLKGNIYLVKVTRVEPSLQAAFIDFGGNRHGFLPFPEIHPDYYRIPVQDREALIAEERALAAEQAAREDEEDAAELAAQGHSLEDFDDEEGEEEEEGGEPAGASPANADYVPRHTGSIAEDIAQDGVSDDSDDEEEEEEEDAQAAVQAKEANESAAQGVEAPQADQPALAEGGQASAEPAAAGAEGEEEKEDLETVGGDAVESPVYRSAIKRRYKIQEVIKRNQIMLIQISKEERGNKGAAVTSYISLPGRYCVLMPNSPRGGGVSRKVSNAKDRQRLKKILHELNVPEGMSVILRTAGVARTTAEIKRDLDYLLRLWDQIRELTLKSTAPALIYEEGNLIKRAIRDLYRRDLDEVHVAGQTGFETARDFMKTLMPTHAERIHPYNDPTVPLFFRYQVETQIDEIHSPTVHLKSGGYIVINPTEAMVSIDVNSGRATKGRHIEETALKTNIEAAEEIARQLRLRDQGGLIVIDFIDMEDKRNNRIVERKLRDAMQNDRARIQLGRISAFGLLELSRQRLHPSLVETNFEVCKHCTGSGLVRTVETTAVLILRALEEEGLKGRATEVKVSLPTEIALYIFNSKREMLAAIEKRYNIKVLLHADDELLKPAFNIEVVKGTGVQRDTRPARPAPVQTVDMSDLPELTGDDISDDRTVSEDDSEDDNRGNRHEHGDGERGGGRDRGHRHGGGRRDRNDRGGRNRHERGERHDRTDRNHDRTDRPEPGLAAVAEGGAPSVGDDDADRSGRRRGRRGGRRRGRNRGDRPFGGRPQGEQGAEGQPGEFVDLAGSPQPDITGGEFVAEGVTEGGEAPAQNGNREHGNRDRGGRDRNRGGRNRHRGGRDRGGERRHGGERQDNAAGAEGQQASFSAAQSNDAPRQQEQRQDHGHSHAGHDHSHGGHDNQHSEAATGTDDGKARKGWWKRLTE
ncbi:MAG TPA: ribonuclease E/G [Patescibacteria group bacterium]|nr:ribonuclease E/G [Patescibacteria group bacterium]